MENRRTREVFWVVLGAGMIAWLVLGFTLDHDDFPANDVFDVFSVGLFLMALVFVIVYTLAGFIGPEPRARWWKNEVGTYLVLSFVAILFIVGPVAFAVLFNNGQINTWWWAWTWIGGHAMGAFMIGSLAYLWIRNTIIDQKKKKVS